MAYTFAEVNGEKVEICDECGFNGGLVSPAGAVRRLNTFMDDWRAVMAVDVELARARPEPATWCPVEYAVHLAWVVRVNDWQARQLVEGLPTALTETPRELMDAYPGEMPEHACASHDLATVLDDLEAAMRSLGAWAETLASEDLTRPGLFSGIDWLKTDALGVIRHVLHDAEHHLLDIRRGIAKPVVAANPLVPPA